jgi:hypothetical protein
MARINEALADLISSLDETFASGQFELGPHCQDAFSVFAQIPGIGAELINRELSRLVSRPPTMGDWRPGEVIVHADPRYTLSMVLRERARPFIHSSPAYELQAIISPLKTAIHYTYWRFPEGYRNDTFDPDLRLIEVSTGALNQGEVARIGPEQVFDLAVNQPVALLRLTSAPVNQLEWLFSREGLRAWKASDARLRDTQARIAALSLGRLATRACLEPLVALTAHPHHAVRWTAVQGIGRLSRAIAIEHLKVAATDRHPHVRQAAARALERIESE